MQEQQHRNHMSSQKSRQIQPCKHKYMHTDATKQSMVTELYRLDDVDDLIKVIS